MNAETRDLSDWKLPFRIRFGVFSAKIAKAFTTRVSKTAKPLIPITNAFNLGLLNKQQIEQLVQYSYASHPNFYDPGKYDYAWEEDIIEPLRETTSKRQMLVAFCGKGRESEIFSRNGFEVTGIDREPFMIDDAIRFSNERGYDANFQCVNFDDYQPESPYGIVYTSTWMYTTYLDRHDRLGFLNKCRDLCSGDGVIVISYCIRNDSPLDTLLHLITRTVSLITFSNGNTVKGDRIERGLFWHYFTNPEIEKELDAAGMETVFRLTAKTKDWEWRFLRPLPQPGPAS